MMQERQIEEATNASEADYKRLCQLKGIINDEVEEVNDLNETILMTAAAEGRWNRKQRCVTHFGTSGL